MLSMTEDRDSGDESRGRPHTPGLRDCSGLASATGDSQAAFREATFVRDPAGPGSHVLQGIARRLLGRAAAVRAQMADLLSLLPDERVVFVPQSPVQLTGV